LTSKKTSKKQDVGALICAPTDIFDPEKLAKTYAANLPDDASASQKKSAFGAAIKEAWTKGHALISDAFLHDPQQTRQTIRSYTYLSQVILKTTMEFVQDELYPRIGQTKSEQLALMFVGGSGRSEMAPHSDIDLLFVRAYKSTAWVENVIETILHFLWDMHVKVGYAVRDVDDCINMARGDYTIRTNLLEARFVCGDEALATTLEERLWNELFAKTGPEFVEAKLDERAVRHKKNGGSRYMVEPNVKEGKGGLRDMQTLYWIAKYLYGTKSVNELVKKKVFTRTEHKAFSQAEAFLWMTRCMLHLKARRASEKLTFDMQVEIASALGYEDQAGRRGVEVFMQDYFKHAVHVGELTRVFLTQLEDEHVKQSPSIGTRLRRVFGFEQDITGPGFQSQNGRLGIADPKTFFDDPVNILRVFEEALRTELLIHPETMRLLTSKISLIDETVQNDPVANQVFLNVLLGTENPERGLRRMNELGVLGAFMPEFANIVAMMQFNMYHSYTVDEHTIQCLSILSQIERGELTEDLPVVSSILEGSVDRKVLYVALLLHDIGKGRPEDHSVIGAQLAAQICPRLGLSQDQTDTVVWLVRNHLLMSDVAQKRDISDIRTVRTFAEEVRTVKNLKLLTVLTVCDIRGVGPDVWNNWKAVLLRELYAHTLDELLEGTDTKAGAREARVEMAKKDFKKRLRDMTPDEIEVELGRHYAPFWLGCDAKTQVILSRLSRNLDEDQVTHDIQMDKSRDATRACFAMADHPGIFSRMTGALALAGANIKDARTYTSADGVATSVFWIQDNEGQPFEKARLGRLRKLVDQALKNPVKTEDLKKKDLAKRKSQAFNVPTVINIDNDSSETFTLIEVDTKDRPGLLHDLSRTITSLNLSIYSAIIATYGSQAVDTFYVRNLIGLKVYDEDRCARIERKLREAVENSEAMAQDTAA
jgi:[protein-PII] uridylyltransferase